MEAERRLALLGLPIRPSTLLLRASAFDLDYNERDGGTFSGRELVLSIENTCGAALWLEWKVLRFRSLGDDQDVLSTVRRQNLEGGTALFSERTAEFFRLQPSASVERLGRVTMRVDFRPLHREGFTPGQYLILSALVPLFVLPGSEKTE